jgi:hypothetical protein
MKFDRDNGVRPVPDIERKLNGLGKFGIWVWMSYFLFTRVAPDMAELVRVGKVKDFDQPAYLATILLGLAFFLLDKQGDSYKKREGV